MLTWTQSGDTHTAKSKLFQYTVQPIDGQFWWSMTVVGRMRQGEKVIEGRQYVSR
jgi:hypothetical protein